MKELIIKEQYLPDTIDSLREFILIGQQKLKAYQAKVKAIDNLNLAKEVREQAIQDGQDMGKALLYAEAKMGYLLENRPEVLPSRRGSQSPLPEGITHKQSHVAQKIADNPTIVEEVIKDAEEYEDIPTKFEVLRRIKNKENTEKIEEQKEKLKEGLKEPTGLFDVIVIDPPWPYGTQYDSEFRRVGSFYPEMPIEEIKSIQLPSAEDCILWLWTTHRFMRDSFSILDAWGFREVSILTWAKNRIGIGHWLRSQTEFCIMAVKGKPKVNLTNQSTILDADIGKHSEKPQEFYDLVNKLCIGRKMDYFCGVTKREGWDSYGTL